MDLLQQRKRLAHSARAALELITDEELPQWKITQLRQAPDTILAEIVEALSERVVKLEAICNKSAIRLAKAEKRLDELQAAKAKPKGTRTKRPPAEEE